jgi:hypothetical protein
LQSLKPIEKYIGETLETKYLGQNIYLNNEIYLSIQNILSNIELKPIKNNIEAKRNKAVKHPIQVIASYYETEQLPISNQDSTSFVYQNILKTLPMPSTRVILNVTGLLIFIESEELNLGKELTVLHIEPKIKESFSEKGFSFTDDIAGADIYITIKARSREGSEMFGMYSAFVDVTVSALEMSSGEEIYKNVFNNVNGQGVNTEKAGLKAFENAAEKISDNMVPKIIQTAGQ